MISVEDRRFRSHIGVDPIGIARSIKVRIEPGTGARAGRPSPSSSRATSSSPTTAPSAARSRKGSWRSRWSESSPRTRSSSSTSTVSISAAALMASTPPRGRFFGHGADHFSLGEAAIIAGLVKAPSNYSPTADAEAARDRSGVVLETMVDERLHQRRGGRGRSTRRTSGSSRPRKQNSVRYFTDWALPQLDTLIDETGRADRRVDHARPGMQVAADQAIARQYAGRRARRAGRARPRRRGAGDGRRARLCRFALQPRDPGRAAAGLGIQAVRLSVRARNRA